MNIQFNTDNNITGSENLNEKIRTIITNDLSRYSEQITRIEVHLSDDNSHKEGETDKRCMIEARLEGIQPIAVTGHGDNIELSVKTALSKLKGAIDSVLGRLSNH
jgi:ribosome-associated translation inhibitor RaiA